MKGENHRFYKRLKNDTDSDFHACWIFLANIENFTQIFNSFLSLQLGMILLDNRFKLSVRENDYLSWVHLEKMA